MKKIAWLNHVIEFVVVLLGVLIAFQMNTCATHKQQQVLVTEHMENLANETNDNLRFINFAQSHAESHLALIDSIIILINKEEGVNEINQVLLKLLNLGGVYLKKNAYNTLVATGDIRFIKDFETKNTIVNLYEFYDWVQLIDKLNVEFFNSEFYPYVMDNLDLIDGKPQQEAVYFSKRLKNILGSYKYFIQQRIGKYTDCEEEINNTLKILK